MVTADEVAQVALFATLDGGQREQLSRVVADINLAPGEYAADQGSERALFAVLSGKIESVQHVDGIARSVGVGAAEVGRWARFGHNRPRRC